MLIQSQRSFLHHVSLGGIRIVVPGQFRIEFGFLPLFRNQFRIIDERIHDKDVDVDAVIVGQGLFPFQDAGRIRIPQSRITDKEFAIG